MHKTPWTFEAEATPSLSRLIRQATANGPRRPCRATQRRAPRLAIVSFTRGSTGSCESLSGLLGTLQPRPTELTEHEPLRSHSRNSRTFPPELTMGLDVEEGRKPLQLPGAAEPPSRNKPGKTPERAARGDWLLAFFRLINVITISCAALCMVAGAMALVARGKPDVRLLPISTSNHVIHWSQAAAQKPMHRPFTDRLLPSSADMACL